MSILDRMNSFSETTLGFILWLFPIVGPPVGIALHCVYQVSIGNGHEQFRLAFVDIPKYLGAGASYLDVLILDVLIILALCVGLGLRYYYFRHERDFIKKYNIKVKPKPKYSSDSKESDSGYEYDD